MHALFTNIYTSDPLTIISFSALSTSIILICKCMSSSVTLTADAFPIPGGYIVPERGNVTFTCSSSSSIILLWKVDFKILGNTTYFNVLEDVTALDFVSSSHGNQDNPANITVHNIPLESNGSFVACTDGASECNATVFVQGKNYTSQPVFQ